MFYLCLDLIIERHTIRASKKSLSCEDNEHAHISNQHANNYDRQGSSVLFACGEYLGDLSGVIF